jgi:transaldolase
MKENYFKRVQKNTPTRFWINNVTREEAKLAVEEGAEGCTQNPSYVWKILNGPDAGYAVELIKDAIRKGKTDDEIMVWLQRELVGVVAKEFMTLYRSTFGRHGFVSIQGDPFKEDTESIVRFARYNREAGENIMAKIPVTQDGLKAIEILVKERIPINATECMAVRQVLDVCEVYMRAIKDMENPAPLYFSLITGIFDEHLHSVVEKQKIEIDPDVLWQAGICVAKKVVSMVTEHKYPCGFIGGGARGLHHFTEMVGADACITINWIGTADKLIEQDPPVVARFLQPIPPHVVDELAEKLDDFRKAYFVNAIKPEEYEEYGPVVRFRNSFENGWKSSVEYIRSLR